MTQVVLCASNYAIPLKYQHIHIPIRPLTKTSHGCGFLSRMAVSCAPLSNLFFYSSLLPRSFIVSELGSIVSVVCLLSSQSILWVVTWGAWRLVSWNTMVTFFLVFIHQFRSSSFSITFIHFLSSSPPLAFYYVKLLKITSTLRNVFFFLGDLRWPNTVFKSLYLIHNYF